MQANWFSGKVRIKALTDFNITEPYYAELESSYILVAAPNVIVVNGYNFKDDAGFPQTGFNGAGFQILINGEQRFNRDYEWKADRNWVSVDSAGTVTFIASPTSSTKKVTITAKSRLNGVERGRTGVYI